MLGSSIIISWKDYPSYMELATLSKLSWPRTSGCPSYLEVPYVYVNTIILITAALESNISIKNLFFLILPWLYKFWNLLPTFWEEDHWNFNCLMCGTIWEVWHFDSIEHCYSWTCCIGLLLRSLISKCSGKISFQKRRAFSVTKNTYLQWTDLHNPPFKLCF